MFLGLEFHVTSKFLFDVLLAVERKLINCSSVFIRERMRMHVLS